MCIYGGYENLTQWVNVLVSKEACKVPDQNIPSIGEISLISKMEELIMNCFSPKTFLKNMKQCAYISNLNQFLSMEKLNFDSDVTEMQNRFIKHSCLKLQKAIPTACLGRNIYFYSHLFISYCQRLDLHEGRPEHVGLVLFL